MANTLADLANAMKSRSASPQVLGSGAASKAGSAIKSRGYQLYVQEQQAQGLSPVSPEEYAAGKR